MSRPSFVYGDLMPAHERLSKREMQVFLGIAQGKLHRQIAIDLAVSRQCVSEYRERITKKTRMATDYSIVAYAFRSGLVR